MKTVKLQDNGTFIEATNPIWTETEMIANPTQEMLLELGYKPLIETEMPQEEGFYFTPTYTETETEIVQEWKKHEIIIQDDFEIDELTQ